jgi:hypothetical protein
MKGLSLLGFLKFVEISVISGSFFPSDLAQGNAFFPFAVRPFAFLL